ncbi:MAG: family 78 glycoside hydrolase catalytic domain [Firmicutes bacterium]|nr:family 78 glycoside hydrolase catalytic domain [Bacillota bacterium]
MRITGLSCDYMENPVGFDFARPLLGWIVEAGGHNRKQSAYQLQVALDEDFSELVHDSGIVKSEESNAIPLAISLRPCTRYYWRVRVWAENGEDASSEAAYFETARFDTPWQAKWIGGGEQLRRSFTLTKPLKRARLYASGVGLYKAFCNGRPVSDEVLAPGFHAYDHWIAYQTYDLTEQLVLGENVLGAWLANGYYKGRVNWKEQGERRNIYGDHLGFIAELHLEYTDGEVDVLSTDVSWKADQSPFMRSEIYDGEVYDARLCQEGWNAPGFDDSKLENAVEVEIDRSLLQARKAPPMKVMERLGPPQYIRTPAGEDVLDFGQNFAGWVRFSVFLPAGEELFLQFGEALDQHGNFYRDNMRTALAELRYISDGKPAEYAPSFTFFGFRYMRIQGLDQIQPEDFTAEVIYTEMKQTGHFECSNQRVNRLFLNALWGQKSNFLDIPTDCPQRDERMGWTGDAQIFCASACFNMQTDAFYHKYLYDLALEQEEAGFVPVIVPNILKGTGIWQFPTTGWGDAATIIPWTMYRHFGDYAVLEKQYDSMKAWVEYMRSQDTLGVNRFYGRHLGDWLAQDTKDPDNLHGLTPPELIATAYYAYSSELLSKTAKILGKEDDSRKYAELAEAVRQAFRDEFVSPNGRVVSETQTALAISLQFNMVLPEQRPKVIEQLAERLRIDKYLLTTGFLGTPYLCPALSENGLDEYAYELLLADECPSWLYAVDRGATTMWERWNSIREDGSMGDVRMNSFNHYAFGAIAEWMYRYAAGINPVEDHAGFRKMLLAPRPSSHFAYTRAELETPYGTVSSAWRLENGVIELEFKIPFNTEAEIRLPDAAGAEIVENDRLISEICFVRGSGIWSYRYKYSGENIDKRVPELGRWG